MELSLKGGSEMHYHKSFTETFIAKKDAIELKIEETTQVLNNGAQVSVLPLTLHKFYNPNDYPVLFEVKIQPASINFEAFLQIMYGLARDGKTNKKGIPRNLLDIGAISLLGETYPPRLSLLNVLSQIFRYIGHLAEKRGVLSQLRDRYVQF